jgi:hypothetical protein
MTAAASEGTPFKSLAAGNIQDTVLPAFASVAGGTHPYQRGALLQKIYNNITTTSNVFAVWWTVGYFEVVDETVSPPRLGQEIGRSENRNIRHRFFAIVDRSGMQLFNTTSASAVAIGAGKVVNYNPVNIAPNTVTSAGLTPAAWSNVQTYGVSDTVLAGGKVYISLQTPNLAKNPAINPAFWLPVTVQPGMLLEVDSGPNMEVVAVTAVAGNTFTANFTKAHAAGVPIVCRGNPGPQVNYNPHRDNNVVLHMSVIK